MTPLDLVFDERVSGEDVRRWLVLDTFAWKLGSPTFEAPASQLAALFGGKGINTARRSIDSLEAAGWLVIERNRGRNRPNRITVVNPCRYDMDSPVDNLVEDL